MIKLPIKAPRKVRLDICEALKDPARRLIDGKSTSHRWLIKWGIKHTGLFNDLIDGLQGSDNLFLKPQTGGGAQQNYQCILDYSDAGGDLPAVLVHVTLAPRGEPLRVRVRVHPSDTVKSLPPLRVT